MELHIVTGRAGAGKSRKVLETVAAQRFQRPQVLLVPEHATHEARRLRGGATQPLTHLTGICEAMTTPARQ